MRTVPIVVAGAAVALLAFLPASPATGTTVVRLELDQLVDQAEGIFTGQAVHSEVVPSRDGNSLFTFVTFEVDSALKGVFPGRHLTLRLHGGELEGVGVLLYGMPRFEVGESYLVFVRGNGVYASPVLGWMQGQLRIAREARSGKPILVDWRGAPVLGIAGGRFERGRPQDLDPAGEPGALLLSEEGVEVRPLPSDQEAAPDEIPAAAQVLGDLQAFVRARSGRATFAPGRRIESANPLDVPARAGGALVPFGGGAAP